MLDNKASNPKPGYWELRLRVPCDLADDVAGLLVHAGADGAEIRDATDAARDTELVIAYALSSDPDLLTHQAADVAAELGLRLDPDTIDVSRRDDVNWAEGWKQYFRPLRIGQRLWIVPSWERSFAPPAPAIPIVLDPGNAFGTGQHQTTALCLEVLEDVASGADPDTLKSCRVLDVGCGSGILAIAAAKLKMGSVVAIDNDPIAVATARENCANNGVGEIVTVGGDPVTALSGPFDLVLANILANTLCDLAEPIIRQVAIGGRAVLSGILTAQADEVVATYRATAARLGASGFDLANRRGRGEWTALVFARPRG